MESLIAVAKSDTRSKMLRHIPNQIRLIPLPILIEGELVGGSRSDCRCGAGAYWSEEGASCRVRTSPVCLSGREARWNPITPPAEAVDQPKMFRQMHCYAEIRYVRYAPRSSWSGNRLLTKAVTTHSIEKLVEWSVHIRRTVGKGGSEVHATYGSTA